MAFEELIRNACEESLNGTRKGDKEEEILTIQNYVRNAKKIIIPNKNGIKVEVLNKALKEFGLPLAKHLNINTNASDSSRYPAIAKGIMAVDQSHADLVIARGRLGVPGSGSLLVFMDNKGRILTCGVSPSHLIHKKSLEDAVYDEVVQALEKIGFRKKN